MKGLTILLILMSAIGMFFITGCNEEDVLAPDEFAPPTNLKALSKDVEVTLSWTAAPGVSGDDFVGYRIMTREGSVLRDSIQVGKTATSHTVTNLTNGTTYTFSIRSVKDNGDVSAEVTLQWGPTQRFSVVNIYEFNSVGNPSGLQFSTGSALAFDDDPPNDNRTKIDLWIDGRVGEPLLKSPDEWTIDHPTSTGWRTTQFVETTVSDLNVQVDVPPIGSFRSTPGLTIIPNKVYFARTQDGHYVRFRVSAVQGSAPNRFVSITIAYNSGTGVWAKQ